MAPKQVDLQHTLGSGSFGEVWKAVVSGLKGVAGETTVAVKKLKRKSFQNRMFFFYSFNFTVLTVKPQAALYGEKFPR